MTDRVQIGVRVDKRLWREFRDDVQDRKGQTRGVLGEEVENALRQYIVTADDRTDSEQLARMHERLERIENKLGTVDADGGTRPSDADTHAHAPTACGTKPAANAPTADKVDYLADRVVEEQSNTGEVGRVVAKRESIAAVVVDEYDFGDRTVPKYVDRIIDRLELRPHPEQQQILLGPTEYDNVIEDL